MPGQIVRLQLDTFTFGGEAMGRLPDGRALFVPFALPGETVTARLREEKPGYARADLIDIEEPCALRIAPRCRHFQSCGGCHYQHLPYAEQLKAKQAILRDQLVRIGKIENPPMRPIVPSPLEFGYRNSVQFHLDRQGKLGFKAAASDTLVSISECHLLEPALSQAWPQLDFEAMPQLERIHLRLGTADDLMLILESSSSDTPDLTIEELPLSVVHLAAGEALVLAGSRAVAMQVHGRLFQVSAGSFFQVNTPMAEALVDGLLQGLARHTRLDASATVLDVYCGVGLFSAFLAPQVGRLVGIESSPSAVEDFTVNLDEFEHVEIYEDLAENVLPQLELHQPQAVVVDPPRAGLNRRALEALLQMQPGVLAYISCDPATLARDGRKLAEGGYRLAEITPFDLFPQTYHIESLSFWVK